MLGRIVLVVVDALNESGDAVSLTGSGDDDFLGASSDVTLSSLVFDEEAGGFDDDVDTKLFPGKALGSAGTHDLDLMAVDHDHIVFLEVGRRFHGGDFTGKAAWVESYLSR